MEWHIERLESCTSTMDEARDRAHDDAPDGTLVVADQMTGGRGRHDRAWHAPKGGWYASFILRDLHDARLLTLALGNAVADVLEVAGVDPQVKWVNDVLVDGKKIAGVLVEAESTGDEVDFLVAGIGINLNGSTEDWPDDLAQTATTLEQELGVDTCIEDTEPFFLDALAAAVEQVRAGRSDDILAAFRRRDALAGRTVEVDGTRGEVLGITDDGALRVGDDTVQAGTVTIVD